VFEQYVLRAPKAAIVVVLDAADRVLMMWRHRFRHRPVVWELPGENRPAPSSTPRVPPTGVPAALPESNFGEPRTAR
jgi:hypothetical protein